MTTSATVTQYYNNVLQRDPTASELSSSVALIDSGALTSGQVLESIIQSTEGQTYAAQVIRFYQAAFGRVPDTTGINGWVDDVLSGAKTTTDLAVGFVLSPEWTVRYGTSDVNAGTLQALYGNVLGRTASGAEIDAWLATGQSMDQILIGFANSAEFQNNIKASVDALLTSAGNTATADVANVYDGMTSLGTGTTGSTFVLTIGADNFTGTASGDTFAAADTTAATWTVGDAIDGGAGNDTFNVTTAGAAAVPVGVTVANIETMNVLSGTSANLNTTTFTGLTALNVTSPAAVTLTSAATTDVTVTNATQGASAISVNGGKDVSVTGSTSVASGATGGAVAVGATTAAAGAVTVTENVVSTNVTNATAATGGTIAVTGGTAVTVNQNVSGASVATTNVTVNAVGGAVTVTGDASTTAATVNQTAAVVAVPSATVGVHGIKAGDVTINDKNAGSTTLAGTIATATLKNYGDATINSNALTTVNLEGTGGRVGITTDTLTTAVNKTLALNVNGLSYKNATLGDNAITVDTDVTKLDITSSTAASTVAALSSTGATAVNVAGDALLTVTANTLNAAAVVTVTNTAGFALGGTIGAGATFTGGAGADAVTLSNSFTKAITMGAGNDTVTVGGALIGTGGSADGGDGIDTVVMTSALADGFDANATFNSKFTNFETLQLSDALAAGDTLNLVGINGVSTVVLTAGGADIATSILSNLDSGGTVKQTGNGTGFVVQVTNAAFNPADVFNLDLSKTTILATGTVTADNVETVNITTTDAATAGSAAALHTLTLVDDDATTITVTGNNGLTLNNVANTAVTSFDASGVVGNGTADTAINLAVQFISANVTGGSVVTITGGAGNDTLTGNAGIDTITGGEGIDLINGGARANIIVLTETTAAQDTVSFTVPGTLNATGNADTLTNFATTSDKMSFDGITVGGAITAVVGTAVTAGSVTAGALTDDTINVVDNANTALTATGVQSIASFTDLDDVAAYLNEGYTATTTSDAAVFVLNDLAGQKTYVYLFDEQTVGASTIQAADMALLAIVTETGTGAIVAGDIA